MRKKLLLLLGIMVIISITGGIIINLFSTKVGVTTISNSAQLKIVTTFYPVYMIGQNLAGDSEDIQVRSLTELNTGCLHDYQLTTEDMKLISDADVLVINGGGMEGFLEDIIANYPELTVIDASEGITMLKEDENDDEHEGDIITTGIGELNQNKDLEEDREEELEEGLEVDLEVDLEARSEVVLEEDHEDHDHGEYNAHVWLDPQLYMKQIENVRDGLIKYINATEFSLDISASVLENEITENAQVYITEVKKLDIEIEDKLSAPDYASEDEAKAVIFHDSFRYLAERVGIEVAYTVPLDSDTALSAGDIATIIDAVKKDNIKFLFTEEQYSDSIAKQIEAETDAVVYIIDSVVTGGGSMDSYLQAMRNNIEIIRTAQQQ